MLKRITQVLLALTILSASVAAQPATNVTSTSTLDFFGEQAYWLHKGFNDDLFQVNSGSFNEANSEEASELTKHLLNSFPLQRSDLVIIYRGRQFDGSLPALRHSSQ